MRLSRGCYDKFHRCPGWIGGGLKYPKVDRCDNGRIQIDYDARWWKWTFQRCNRCDVLVLPYLTRWLDPTWIAAEIRHVVRYRIPDWIDELRERWS